MKNPLGHVFGTSCSQAGASARSWPYYGVIGCTHIGNRTVTVGSAMIFAVLFCGFILAVSSVTDVYGTSTTITLDRLPDSVYVGQLITFTGTLTSGSSLLSGGIVLICEDDPFIPDECLASGITDRLGRYSIEWIAEAGTIEVDFDIYAEFSGAGGYSSSQTPRQTMSVTKYDGSLVLDTVPARAAYGEAVTFSGTLQLDGHSPVGSIIYIQDEDAFNPDDLLTSAYVDHTGHFKTTWIVEDVDPDYTIDIQAVYESNSLYYRMATPVQYLRAYDGSPALPQPDPSPASGDGYMELYHALDFEQPPRIAIVPAPDSYDKVRKHIVPVQEGILQLTAMLEREYETGDWGVEFHVIEPGARIDVKPDIMINLFTSDEDVKCGVDYAGVAQVRPIVDPMPTTVCSLDHSTDAQIGSTAAHEFVHAMGVGHTFNIPGDMLCSIEDGHGETCPNVYNKSTTPSVLNLAAVAAVYGTDGFQNPNNHVIYKERFRLSSNDQISPPDQGSTTTPATTHHATGILYTDFEQYREGEAVLVDGIFLEAYEGETLELSLVDRNGDLVDWVYVFVEGGQFTEFFYTTDAGTYSILLHDSEYDIVATASFDVAGSTDAVIFTDYAYYDPGETIVIDGFYWGSYDGPSSIVVFGPDWDVVDWIDVDVVEDFFETSTWTYLPGRYAVDMYDEWGNFVASTAFIVVDP